jgi:hypothetical protein
MIHPTIRLAAAAVREGCPESIAAGVAAAVLRVAGSEMAQHGLSTDLPYQWAAELERGAAPPPAPPGLS